MAREIVIREEISIVVLHVRGDKHLEMLVIILVFVVFRVLVLDIGCLSF